MALPRVKVKDKSGALLLICLTHWVAATVALSPWVRLFKARLA